VQRIPWHQDAFYYPAWNAADGRLVTCWIPLVAVDERSGCLQIVPCSHLGGFLSPKPENGQLVVDPAGVTGEPLSVPLQPGDVLLFDALMLHRANDNVADYVRWNVDIRFGAATPAIAAKNPQGYVCRSASGVEPYAVWAARYGGEFEYSAHALAALLGVEGESVDDVVKAAGLSTTELRAW
jgi:ectoine hydroxylase-related dioxygenase (phytanoyl-CoA dioxygenase family)